MVLPSHQRSLNRIRDEFPELPKPDGFPNREVISAQFLRRGTFAPNVRFLVPQFNGTA